MLSMRDLLKLSLPAGGVILGLGLAPSYFMLSDGVTAGIWSIASAILALVVFQDIWRFHRDTSYQFLATENARNVRIKLYTCGFCAAISGAYLIYLGLMYSFQYFLAPFLAAVWSLTWMLDLWKYHGGAAAGAGSSVPRGPLAEEYDGNGVAVTMNNNDDDDIEGTGEVFAIEGIDDTFDVDVDVDHEGDEEHAQSQSRSEQRERDGQHGHGHDKLSADMLPPPSMSMASPTREDLEKFGNEIDREFESVLEEEDENVPADVSPSPLPPQSPPRIAPPPSSSTA